MSTNLMWKPVVKDQNYIGSEIRDLIIKKYGYKSKLSYQDLEYLKGLRDAGKEEASDLIDAINEHEEIEVWEE